MDDGRQLDDIQFFLITWNKHTNDDFNDEKNKSLFLMKIRVFFALNNSLFSLEIKVFFKG